GPNLNGWNNTDVTVNFTCADTGLVQSGIDVDTVAADDDTVTTEGANQPVSSDGDCVDNAGNSASTPVTVLVSIDKTAPVITDDGPTTAANVNGWYNADVVNEFSVDAGISGPDATCAPAFSGGSQSKTTTGEGFAVTVTSDGCTDLAGNTAGGKTSAGFQIDKTKPTSISFAGGGINEGDSFFFGFVPAGPSSCDANYDISGSDGCVVTGPDNGNAVGPNKYTATATDLAGNVGTFDLNYTVDPWTLQGFFQPVDMGGLYNTVKNGSTVPLKFRIFAGTTELTDVSAVSYVNSITVPCSGATPVDAIEEIVTTGSTVLRYDTVGQQFIDNWKTPKGASWVGKCLQVQMKAADGSSLYAWFKLK
ncbi:MAG TPA: PxKF domain-containing protein, partial [Candidatus Limnocylindria bacterium]|nr:PxKF domain-containing protein [Candidatus Limnocylindria bacterium]